MGIDERTPSIPLAQGPPTTTVYVIRKAWPRVCRRRPLRHAGVPDGVSQGGLRGDWALGRRGRLRQAGHRAATIGRNRWNWEQNTAKGGRESDRVRRDPRRPLLSRQ